MKRKEATVLPCVIGVTLLFGLSVTRSSGHDEPVHEEITQAAAQVSDGLNSFLREHLGAANARLIASGSLFPTLGLSPVRWLRLGSNLEDKQRRYVQHFYTLDVGKGAKVVYGLTDNTELWFYAKFPNAITDSYTWGSAMGQINPYTGEPNGETWQSARAFQYEAVRHANRIPRDDNFARMLYALGHVLHLNQDLSQPDHTRNDEHPKRKYIEPYGLRNYITNPNWFASPPMERRGWPYWRTAGFRRLRDFWDRNLYMGTPQPLRNALNRDANNEPGWRLGLAEFSNGNFLGEHAIYAEYFTPGTSEFNLHFFPFPSLYTSTNYKQVKQRLLASHLDPMDYADGTSGNRVYLRKVADGVRNFRHSVLPYLITMRINSPQSLQWSYKEGAPHISHPNVLQDYHSILIPKAVEYSAGILDYFFRGRMVVEPSEPNPTTVHIRVTNTSGQDFRNGAFHLLFDDANGNRTEVPLVNSGYNNALPDGASFEADFMRQSARRYRLIFRGIIGSANGAAVDPVDADQAIATATFVTCSGTEQGTLTSSSGHSRIRELIDAGQGFFGTYYADTVDFRVSAGANIQLTMDTGGQWAGYMYLLVKGTATAGTQSSLIDSGGNWTPNAFQGASLFITSDTGMTYILRITGNTQNELYYQTTAFVPDTTSKYSIALAGGHPISGPVPTTETYTIEVTTRDSWVTGSYTLTINCGASGGGSGCWNQSLGGSCF